MATSGSVSKGCFAFKGKKKAVNLEIGKCGHLLKRDKLFQETWMDIQECIKEFQSNMTSKIYRDLFEFIQFSHKNFSLAEESENFVAEIPTAALVTGVNVTDHAAIFKNLIEVVEEKVTPHVVVLQSKDSCKLKNLLTKTIEQLLQAKGKEVSEINLKHINSTMSVIASWYIDLTKKKIFGSPRKSPRKRSSSGFITKEKMDYKPVVIILEDLEAFDPPVLQDFITICSNHLHEIPLVFVFGIATNIASVHRLLPHAVSSQLCLEMFQAPPSTDYLTQVLNQVIMTSRFPFKLGAKVFQLLLDIFLCHDFSVYNYLAGIQFCMMEHYTSNPVSTLCCSMEKIHEAVSKLSSKQLDEIRALSSFRKYVEELTSLKEKEQMLLNDIHTKETVIEMLEDMDLYHSCFFPVLTCLNILTSGLPKHPLGKQLRELYSSTLLNEVYLTEEYKDSIILLRTMSRNDLVSLLHKCVSILHSEDVPEILRDAGYELLSYIDKFDNIEDMAELVKDVENQDDNSESIIPKKTDMSTLKQKLQNMHKKKKKLTVYELIRNEVIDVMDNLVRVHLKCYKNQTLYEIFYYDQSSLVKRQLAAAPRASIHTGLGNPHYYLQHEDLLCEGGLILATLPDICIVYKLHLECGRMINLYDWLQAFITIVSGDEGISKNPKKPDQMLQARFIRAVSELQFMGFIKPTKRKTDHVARLTWGGC